MDKHTGQVLYIVRTWVPEKLLEEWNEWHTSVHVPEVVEQPQIQRARKYRVLDDATPAEWPAQYITVYELNSVEDWDSYSTGEAAAMLRKDYADHYGATGKISRQVLVEVAEIGPVEVESKAE